MARPHCASLTTTGQLKPTYQTQTFRCAACRCRFDERTSTPCNLLEVPTDIVLLLLLWRLRCQLSLRNVIEMFLEHGFVFTHEDVREWEERFAPLLAERLRARHRDKAGRSWYVYETHH